MAYEPSFERTDAIDGLCMEIAELVGMLSPQAPLSTSPTLRRELRIQTIYSSLVIEGNKLDEHAVSAIIDGKRVLGDRRDILEVENARAAYDLISELDPHSVEDLLRVHRVMMGASSPTLGAFGRAMSACSTGIPSFMLALRRPTFRRLWEASSSGCMRRECTRCSPRVSSTSSSSSVIPSLTAMVGRGVSGRRCSCPGGVRCWRGCPLSPLSGSDRRTITRPWPARVRTVRVRVSWSLCSRRFVNRFCRTRSRRARRIWLESARSLSLAATRMPLSLSLRNILGARSGAPSARSHSSKKKACSSVRGVPVRACGLSTPPDSKAAISSPGIGVETPLLHDEFKPLVRQGVRR